MIKSEHSILTDPIEPLIEDQFGMGNKRLAHWGVFEGEVCINLEETEGKANSWAKAANANLAENGQPSVFTVSPIGVGERVPRIDFKGTIFTYTHVHY